MNENETDETIDDEDIPEGTALSPKEARALRKQGKATERTAAEWRAALRYKVRMFYDLQRLRMQTAGRTKPKADEIQLHEIDVAILEQRGIELATAEKNALNDVKDHLATSAFYTKVLSDKTRFKGLGPTMAAVILAEFDIEHEDTVSKMWAFAGLAPVPAMRCNTCQHLVVMKGGAWKHDWKTKVKCPAGDEMTSDQVHSSAKARKPTKGEKLAYNAFLRAKLIGVLGPCLIKANSPWRSYYDNYKHRKASAGWGSSDIHRHNAAVRYMVKMLLLEIWREWRAHEGLPVREPYAAEYIDKVHNDPALRAAP